MDQTFDKQKVVLAATQAIAWVKAERSRLVAEFDARDKWWRFWNAINAAGGQCRYEHERFDTRRLETAERLIFKASYCEDTIVFLSNDEIDQIKDFWSA